MVCLYFLILVDITTVFSLVCCRKAGLGSGLTLQGTVHPELARSGELVCFFECVVYFPFRHLLKG